MMVGNAHKAAGRKGGHCHPPGALHWTTANTTAPTPPKPMMDAEITNVCTSSSSPPAVPACYPLPVGHWSLTNPEHSHCVAQIAEEFAQFSNIYK